MSSWTGLPGGLGGLLPLPMVPKTSNSCSEYPFVASVRHRLVPNIRTYRPLPFRPVRSSTPPLPVEVEKIDVQVDLLVEVSTRYTTAHDASQVSLTWVMLAVAPR